MTDPERHKNARPSLGFTETVAVKLHPDLATWVKGRAAADYCTQQEVMRRLIVDAMRREQHGAVSGPLS